MDKRIFMRTALNRTGLYGTECENINAELSAYEVGLGMVLDDIEKILDNCFIESADKENLVKRMKLFRSCVGETEANALREELFEKAKIRSSSLSDMQKRLLAVGINGTVSEEKLKATIKVNNFCGIEPEAAEVEMKKYLPVFIELTLEEI